MSSRKKSKLETSLMVLHIGCDASDSVEKRHVLLDNDFLGCLFADKELFTQAVRLLSRSILTIEPFVAFEFLRDIYLPEQRNLREKFLGNRDLFFQAPDHTDVYSKLRNNALILSKIYAHQTGKHRAKPSVVDLILSARLMNFPDHYALITGNTKDFPEVIFDIKSVLTIRKPGDGELKTFGIMQFNIKKYDSCYKNLIRLG